MASNLILRKQRYSGRRRSYIYSTGQCRIAISSTLIRGLCRQGYSFALATPGDTPSVKVVDVGSLGPQAPVSPLCFAAHAVKQCVMHAPGYAAASATLGSQWHKAMPGQSHHDINRAIVVNVSLYTAFAVRLDCTEIKSETSHTRIHRAGIQRVELGGYLSDSPGVEPTPGSTDRTQGVCGVVGLDCADGLEREI